MKTEFDWVEGEHGDHYVSPKTTRGRVVREGNRVRAWVWPRDALVGEIAPFHETFVWEWRAREWVEAKVSDIDKISTDQA